MKLGTFVSDGESRHRIGALCVHDGVEYLIDLATARSLASDRSSTADGAAPRACGASEDMLHLLRGGPATLAAAKAGVDDVRNRLRAAGDEQPLLDRRVLHRRDAVKLLAPIPRPGKVVAIGANYRDHIQEGRSSGALSDLPSYPPAFLKMSTSVVGTDEPILYPNFGDELDYEVELSIVIGSYCQDVAAERWLDVVAGFTIVNDLSMRDVILQEKAAGIVFSGKNFASSCPMGPYLVTADEIPAPGDLQIQLRVNGAVRQMDRTSSMLHDCAAIVAYWSRLGFEPGDVITTGTPGGGAGFGRRYPERLLRPGDVVEAEVEGIGVLKNVVIERRRPHPSRGDAAKFLASA